MIPTDVLKALGEMDVLEFADMLKSEVSTHSDTDRI
jgi:hypothetical protein